MIILAFLFPVLGFCFSSFASSLYLNPSNYQNVSIMVPKIENCGVLYAIRDLDAQHTFEWRIQHQLTQYNQTHNNLSFTIPKWPKQLNSIVYDILLSERNENFRVYHANITQYQTHVPFKQEDYKNGYSLVLFPTGFSQSTLTMNFNWMPVRLSEIFVIHYMDHGVGTQGNHQNFGQNWVSFCVLYVKKQLMSQIVRMDNMKEYQSLQKNSNITYFIGIQKVHNTKAKMTMRQTVKQLIYSSYHVQAVAIPLNLKLLLDTRKYTLSQSIGFFMKIASLIFVVIAVGGIIYIIKKNKTRISALWPTAASSSELSMYANQGRPRQLVQVD